MLTQLTTSTIARLTDADSVLRVEEIQPLWNNYGSLLRVFLSGSEAHQSVILKQIQIPQSLTHPRGFANDTSNSRKVRSYEVERYWYRHFNDKVSHSASPTPECLSTWSDSEGSYILLEDLNTRGYTARRSRLSWAEIQVVIRWLAQFHAAFMSSDTDGLWQYGTYWHLETRPDELENIKGTLLHTLAPFIDARLNNTKFQTILHGDAKLANFCFNETGNKVAAVDFQYVGGGCGMKDLAYFISSCMTEAQAARETPKILDCYFRELKKALNWQAGKYQDLETEWRTLYPIAIADFQRFILGWSPSHYKNTTATQQTTTTIVNQILAELKNSATGAALRAGALIREKWRGEYAVQSKGLQSPAADIVTEVDEQAQQIIHQELQSSIDRYSLGWLAEEGEQDESRLRRHAFWTVDPIDGTLFFAEGTNGFAVSIALVTQSGDPIVAVVLDPATNTLYETTVGTSIFKNGIPLSPANERSELTTLVLDRGFIEHPLYPALQDTFNIVFVGGAVMNGMYLLHHPNAFYMKLPKKRLGGCAIWDLAAIRLFCENAGGSAQFYNGHRLELNRQDKLYFNDVGFVFCGSKCRFAAIKEKMNLL